jgi:hypothetical protein
MSRMIIKKFAAVAFTVAALTTVVATDNAFARDGGGFGGWHRGGYGHGFGHYDRHYRGHGFGRYYGDYGHYGYNGYCNYYHRYWGCEGR